MHCWGGCDFSSGHGSKCHNCQALCLEQDKWAATVNGSSLPFLGSGRFSICLGEEEVFHVLVAEIELDGILVMDFNKKHNCQLTLGKGRYELSTRT